MQLVAVQLVACLGELFCLGNKLLKVEHVQRCATCRQVRLFVAQTGNLLRRQVAHSVQTCNLLPATSCMSGRGLKCKIHRPVRAKPERLSVGPGSVQSPDRLNRTVRALKFISRTDN